MLDPTLRRFFLAAPHDPDAPRLLAGEGVHASRVLRLEAGTRVLGLDGRGGTWPLALEAVARDGVQVRTDGEGAFEPAPGEPGATLPWVEVAVAWPKRTRAGDMLDRLAQLGVASIRPLLCNRSGPAGPPRGKDLARCEKVLREACKQSRRSWMPELKEPLELAKLLELYPDAPVGHLDPAADYGLDIWARSLSSTAKGRTTRDRPTILAIGPEGGFDETEAAAFVEADATSVRLGPHVLRIETAAEASMAVFAAIWS